MKKFIFIFILIAIPLTVYFYHKRHKPNPMPIVSRKEINITIIPGWTLRQIALDWKEKGLIKNEDELYKRVGKPAYNYLANKEVSPILNFTDSLGKDRYPLLATKPKGISYEGYFFPDTYRVYADSNLNEVLDKIFANLENKITDEMRLEIKKQGKDFFTILNMAALIDREANNLEDMRMVSDIFWRRYNQNWPLQSCASVNYITGKNTPAVSATDQQIDSLYNTYKYPGLPLGPVGNPGLDAIKAALYPKSNNYWYFMTGNDGQMYYATNLDEHNNNVYKHLDRK